MMRWKHILLIIITIIFSYSCSAVKTSNLVTPATNELTTVATIVPTNQQSQTSVQSKKENLLQQLNLSALHLCGMI